MLYQANHFEGVRHATRQDHLLPVERAVYPVAPYELWGLLAIFLVAVPVCVGLWWLS